MSDNIDQHRQRIVVFFNHPNVKKFAPWILVGSLVAAVFFVFYGIFRKIFFNDDDREVIFTIDTKDDEGTGALTSMLIVIVLSLMVAVGAQVYRNIQQDLRLYSLMEMIERLQTIWNGSGDMNRN